jgi:gliding motility-associatede transport system auxiliary component
MKKQNQLRLNSAITALLLLALFALCAWLSTRYSFESDMTRTGRHTLSEASLKTLAEADKPLEISAYARQDSELRSAIKKFVDKFQAAKADISLHFVNPDAAPDEVRELGINVNGELVLRYEGRTEHVRTDSEQEFVNALQRLLRGTERWLAFLDGHGERHPGGKANHDLGEWAAQLSYRGFKYRPLNLVETKTIPDNTSVLIIASPRVALLPGELGIIEDYLNKGGNLLWLTDPGEESGMASIAEVLGIKVETGVVIDTAGQLLGINDPTIALTTARLYPTHPVTKDFNLTVFFPKVTAISTQAQQGWLGRPVLSTGNHTWLELGELQGDVDFNPEQEQQGPLTLGLSLERQGDQAQGKQQRVLVIGDGDFLSNTYVGNSGNLELGMRIINWLSSDDSLIAIPTRTVEDAQLNMSNLSLGALGLGFLFFLPLAFLGTGFLLWWRRKKL